MKNEMAFQKKAVLHRKALRAVFPDLLPGPSPSFIRADHTPGRTPNPISKCLRPQGLPRPAATATTTSPDKG